MQISLNVAVGAAGPQSHADVVTEVREAAAAGLAGAWWPQLPPVPGVTPWDALTSIAVTGAAVPAVALGTAVVVAYAQHPFALAGQALTTAAVVGDRLTLGVGVSHRWVVEGVLGGRFDRPARYLREYLEVLVPALRGEAVDHAGEFLAAQGCVDVAGATPPGVVLAALGPAMLRLAGELADGTVTTWTGPATLADRVVPALTRAAAGAGRPAPRVIANLPVCVTADEAAARRFVAERYGAAAGMPSYRAMLDAEGTDLPGVVVAGDEAAVERHLGRLADAGATEFVASPFGSPEDCARTVAVLADLAARHPYVKKPSERRPG